MLLIPSADPHSSEYPSEYFKARRYFSGFTGSAGTLIIWQEGAGLWTDGRYFLQAAQQMEGRGIDLYRMGEPGVPTVEQFILDNIKGKLGADTRCLSSAEGKTFAENGIEIVDCAELIDSCWKERPPLPDAPAYELPLELSGVPAEEKLAAVRNNMAEQGADALIVTALDEVAWLFNIRGEDVLYLPVVMAYAIVEKEDAYLFIDGKKVAPVAEYLGRLGVKLLPYGEIYSFVKKYGREKRIMCSLKKLNYKLFNAVSTCTVADSSLLENMKSVKNATELENSRITHLKDGVAVTRFIRWAKTHASGCFTELDVDKKLQELRGQQEGYLFPSFATIAGYAHHGAIIHYKANKDTSIAVKPEGLLLVDSGGQYMGGTTDVTRTIALGPLTDEERQGFTLVLKGFLALMNLKFPRGCAGYHLDAVARAAFWNRGLDFNHGTGHGVGYMLSVHEGPNGFRYQKTSRSDRGEFKPGMITSDEPGIYFEGKFGVRTENLIECVETGPNSRFLAFRPLTYVPIDLDAVDVEMLSEEEKKQLNEYHRAVYEKLAPRMEREELVWLKQYTRPV